MPKFVRVASTGEIGPGEKMTVEVDGTSLLLVNVNGEYFAIDDICTHDGGPLADGKLENGHVICPRHGARFDVRTGEALSLPAFEGVNSYEVRVEGQDILVESY
jgi:3-phenylpropionate/trans-cinnamate dioxygenase ferredoxin subunit